MTKYYFIKSHLNELVLEMDIDRTDPGALVIPSLKNGDSYQQWRDDPCTGTIRNKFYDFCMDIEDGRLVLNPYQYGKSDQQWERRGNMIVNRSDDNIVIDICNNDKEPRAKVIKYAKHGEPNQTWTFEPVDF